MEDIITLRLTETDSTNRFLREYTGAEGSLMTVVTADYQTAGRGQGRNTWESAPGQNLLFSVKVRPRGLEARRQFVMLEAGALAVRDALSHYADGFTVKWPNDVYWRDMKISGRETDRDEVLGRFEDGFRRYLCMVDAGRYADIHALYCASLYRRTGLHAWRDATGRFTASILRVEPDGRLVLRKGDGEERTYLFKEVEHLISEVKEVREVKGVKDK